MKVTFCILVLKSAKKLVRKKSGSAFHCLAEIVLSVLSRPRWMTSGEELRLDGPKLPKINSWLRASSTDGFSDLKFSHYAGTLQDFIAVVLNNTERYMFYIS